MQRNSNNCINLHSFFFISFKVGITRFCQKQQNDLSMLDLLIMLIRTSCFLFICQPCSLLSWVFTCSSLKWNGPSYRQWSGRWAGATRHVRSAPHHRPWYYAWYSTSTLQCSKCSPRLFCPVLHRLHSSRCFGCRLFICPSAQSRYTTGIRARTEIPHHLCWRCHRYIPVVSRPPTYFRRRHAGHQALQAIASQWGGVWAGKLCIFGEWLVYVKTPSVEYHEDRSDVVGLCDKPQKTLSWFHADSYWLRHSTTN